MHQYQLIVASDPWGAYQSGFYPNAMPGYEQMSALGCPPAVAFVSSPFMNEQTYGMLLAQQAYATQQALLPLSPVQHQSWPPSPHSLESNARPPTIPSPKNFLQALPRETYTENPQTVVGSDPRLVARTADAAFTFPDSAASTGSGASVQPAGEAWASESDEGLSSAASTRSWVADEGLGRHRDRQRHSRKRCSNDMPAATVGPPVTIRTQSWSSEGEFTSGALASPHVAGSWAPSASSPVFDWTSFPAQPSVEIAASSYTVGIAPSAANSPPSKRRKSVSDACPPSITPQPARSSPLRPAPLPAHSPAWVSPAITRSVSDSSVGGDTRVGPFSVLGMPKPPRLNSTSSFVLAPSVATTPSLLCESPPAKVLSSPRDARASFRGPALSSPSSVSDSSMLSGTGARPSGPSRVPGTLNPVAEVNTEWVPSRPRIRKTTRRQLEKRRDETPRIEHVLEDSRPPAVTTTLGKPRKAKGKGRSSSCANTDGSDSETRTERGIDVLWRRNGCPGRASSVSSGEDEDDDDDSSSDEHEAQLFEHGPTELPPRPWAGKSPLDIARKKNIPESALDKIPLIEARFAALEDAVDAHMRSIYRRALRNSLLPGLDYPVDEMQALWASQGGEGSFAPRGPAHPAASPSAGDFSARTVSPANEVSEPVGTLAYTPAASVDSSFSSPSPGGLDDDA